MSEDRPPQGDKLQLGEGAEPVLPLYTLPPCSEISRGPRGRYVKSEAASTKGFSLVFRNYPSVNLDDSHLFTVNT